MVPDRLFFHFSTLGLWYIMFLGAPVRLKVRSVLGGVKCRGL